MAADDPDFVPIDRDDLLATLGIKGERTQFDLAIDRLVAHSLVKRRRHELTVRPAMPPVNDTVLGWLPDDARRYHHEAVMQDGR